MPPSPGRRLKLHDAGRPRVHGVQHHLHAPVGGVSQQPAAQAQNTCWRHNQNTGHLQAHAPASAPAATRRGPPSWRPVLWTRPVVPQRGSWQHTTVCCQCTSRQRAQPRAAQRAAQRGSTRALSCLWSLNPSNTRRRTYLGRKKQAAVSGLSNNRSGADDTTPCMPRTLGCCSRGSGALCGGGCAPERAPRLFLPYCQHTVL